MLKLKGLNTMTFFWVRLSFFAWLLNISTPLFSTESSEDFFLEMEQKLPLYLRISEEADGRDITVFLGNTGVGKSTLINSALDVPLSVDFRGKIEVDNSNLSSAAVDQGQQSVTKQPQYFKSLTLGDMYDLPGFLDTDGALEEVLNACAINAVLTSARSARVVIVTNKSELEDACRGFLSKDLNRSVSMFEDSFLRGNSCCLLVNSVDREILDLSLEDSGILTLLSELNNLKKINKISLLKKARPGDEEDFLVEFKKTLFSFVGSVEREKVDRLNVSRSFGYETQQKIKMFLLNIMRKYFLEKKDRYYQDLINFFAEKGDIQSFPSVFLKGKRTEILENLKGEIFLLKECNFLRKICSEQYSSALEDFEIFFDQEHLSFVRNVEMKEKEAAKEKAEEARKLAEESLNRSQREIDELKSDAEFLQKEKENAEKIACQSALMAEEAKEDSTKSKEEKEAALKACLEAERKLQKSNQLHVETLEKLNRKDKENKQEQERLRKISEEADRRVLEFRELLANQERERLKEKREMERYRSEMEDRLTSLQKENSEESERFRRETERLLRSHRQDMESMQARHSSALAAIQQNQVSSLSTHSSNPSWVGGAFGLLGKVIDAFLPKMLS